MPSMNLRKLGIPALVAGIVVVVAAFAASGAQAQEMRTYTVTVENLTGGQPFTPPVIVAHTTGIDVFEEGQAASDELAQVAENGNADPLISVLDSSDAVHASTVGDAPILPGESATLTVTAPDGSYLSAVWMLICTNDGFSGVDSLQLPTSGSEVADTNSYDAGSEVNTEDFADMVPPCQEVIGVTSDDEGTGTSNPDIAEGGVIAMHPGIQGGTDLTVEDHGWTDPVARVTVSAESDAAEGLPQTGTGPSDDGGISFGLWAAIVAGAALTLVAIGGALQLARRSVRR